VGNFHLQKTLEGSVRIIRTTAFGNNHKVIVIDAGHGGQDPGAQFGGLKELAKHIYYN